MDSEWYWPDKRSCCVSFVTICGGSEKSRFLFDLAAGQMTARPPRRRCLLGAGVLCHRFRAFGHGVLGQLAGQQEPDGRLYFAARDGRAAVVVCQTARFGCYALEDVVDEAVHDGHRLGRDARIGMNLLQHLVDVDGVRLPSAPLPLLLAGSGCFGLRRSLLPVSY